MQDDDPFESTGVVGDSITMDDLDNAEAVLKESEKEQEPAGPSERERVLMEALKISEDARKAMQDMIAGQTRPAQQPTPEPEIDPALKVDDDTLAEMLRDDPKQALSIIRRQMLAIGDAHFANRLAPLANSAYMAQEEAARAKYALEFELFSDQIQSIVGATADKTLLQNPKAWEQLISFVRGQPGNIEKYIEKVAGKQNAQKREQFSAGVSLTGRAGKQNTPGKAEDGKYDLSDLEARAAKVMGMSPKDYVYWRDVKQK